jgi:hypothetical protein
MNTIAYNLLPRSTRSAFRPSLARLRAGARFALRRLATLYAQGCMHQATREIRRFEQCHRPLSERDGGPQSRL